MMQTALFRWQRDRRRKAQRCFASLGGFTRPPLPGVGGKVPVTPDPNAGKDKKKDGGQGEHKADSDDEKGGKKPLGQLLKEKQEELADERAEKPPAARIVAYSDSEGEDEPFRLMRPRKKKKEGDGGQTEAEDDDAAPSTSGSGAQLRLPAQLVRSERRAMRAVRRVLHPPKPLSCARRGFGKLRHELGWGLLLEVVLLWLFRRWRRKDAKRFELLTLAIALPDAVCCLADAQGVFHGLPISLQSLLHFVESWARPAALFQLEDAAQQVLPKKKRRRMLSTISQSVRIFEEAELDAPAESPPPAPRPPPRLAAEAAAQYVVELAEMRRILDAAGARLPAERFDDTHAELLRFATSTGLLKAKSHEEKAHAIQEGAERVLSTVDWLRKYRFMPPAKLKELHQMVRWQGTDTEGWPILVVKVAKACADNQGAGAEAVAEAIVSQMQRAMTEVFSNRHGPDKLVVVLDATGANPLQAARNVALFKQVALLLNKHYPYRLHQLFVVDLPSQLRWVLATLKPLLHPATKEKIRMITMSDPALPLPAHALQDARSEPAAEEGESDGASADGRRRVSIPELPVSSSPPAPSSGESRRGSISALPSALDGRQRRRVRILELPFRELGPKPGRPSNDGWGAEGGSPGGVLRPALKRSMSAGLIGINSAAGRGAVGDLPSAEEAETLSSRRDDLD